MSHIKNLTEIYKPFCIKIHKPFKTNTRVEYMPIKNKPKLKFGIMCDNTTFSAWEAACIKKILEIKYAEPALLIINAEQQNLKQKIKKMLIIKHSLFNFYNHFLVNPSSEAHKKVNMNLKFLNTSKIRCRVVKRGKFSEYFNDEDIKIIREYNLDFILRFGFNIIRGEILKVPKYGVWSFHHGDEQKYRGSPPCFWEIYNNDAVSGVILQKLTDKLDGGIILQKGYFSTINYSYGKSRDLVFFGAAEWPAKVCMEIINNSADYLKNMPSNSSAQVYKRPTNSKMIIYFIKLIRNKLKKLENYLFKHENWNLGIVNAPINKFLDKNFKPKINWLPINKRFLFKADPFGIKDGQEITILFENYDYKNAKGAISFIKIKNNKIREIKEVMNEKFHMSYPYLIKHKRNIYCVPETSEANNVYLYQAIEFPNKWEKVKTIIENISLIDPTIFKYNNYWWLLSTRSGKYPNTKLYIWYAKDLLGSWTQHPSNPVKVDIQSSRPAGTPFIYQNQLYRPAQDCSLEYGKGVVINKITELTPQRFKEEIFAKVEPDKNSSFKDGLHTLSSLGEITIVDGKRYVFSHAFFISRIKKVVNHVAGR